MDEPISRQKQIDEQMVIPAEVWDQSGVDLPSVISNFGSNELCLGQRIFPRKCRPCGL
jgi:hypothetical protein